MMVFDVYDKDIITADDFVARGTFRFDDIFKTRKFEDAIPLEYQGKPAGLLFIKAKFYPDSKTIGVMPQVCPFLICSLIVYIVLTS